MYEGERFNSISHLSGAALALAGLVFLMARAAHSGDPWRIVGAAVYGTTLLLLYLFSTLYHSIRGEGKRVLQQIDHAAIYLLIAGSYTPFTLVTLRGAWGWSLFGVVWGMAFFGIVQDLFIPSRKRIFSVVLYILMGWLSLVAIRPLVRSLPSIAIAALVAGGVFYTIGVVFYVLGRRMNHGHGVFHVFVLLGSICHYFTIALYVV